MNTSPISRSSSSNSKARTPGSAASPSLLSGDLVGLVVDRRPLVQSRSAEATAGYGKTWRPGPSEPGNIACVTVAQNTLEAARSNQVAPVLVAHRGGTKSRPPQPLLRGDGHPRSKAVITPRGRFGSAALAAEAYRINPASASRKAQNRWKGWRYEGVHPQMLNQDGIPAPMVDRERLL